jgi:hypothetical protein
MPPSRSSVKPRSAATLIFCKRAALRQAFSTPSRRTRFRLIYLTMAPAHRPMLKN